MEVQVPAPVNPEQTPNAQTMQELENELNPEAKEFLKNYKTAPEAIA